MTWYLVFRALCVVSFGWAIIAVLCACGFADSHRMRAAASWLIIAMLFTVSGCLLIGVGWSEAHP